MEGFHGSSYLLEEGETLEPMPEQLKRSNSDTAHRELERWDPNKRARHGSFLDAVAIPVPRAQQVHDLFANLERDKYWAEKIKDACVEENQILKNKLGVVCRAHLQRSDILGEKDRRILELIKGHRYIQQERDELLIEQADTKAQLNAKETAYGQSQQQLEASASHHGKIMEEMQQALSSAQDSARQLDLDKSGLEAALTIKDRELRENEADCTKWTTELEEQLKEVRKANRDKDARISNLNQEVARMMKAQETKEKDCRDMNVAFEEEKTRLCEQLKSADNTLRNIHKLSRLPRNVEEQSSGD